MKNLKYLSFVILIFMNSGFLFAQGEAAIPFLLLPVSPEQASIGGAGSSIPTDDVFGFLYNPAQLGYTSQNNNFSFISYPGKADWSFGVGPGDPEIIDMKLASINATALNAGYNFKDIIGVPLSLGLAYANPEVIFNYLGFEMSRISESKNSYSAFSIGAGIDYYIRFYAGISFKNVKSALSIYPAAAADGFIAKYETSVTDYGFLLDIPMVKLLWDTLSVEIMNNSYKPYFNLSLGTAISNIGGEVYYIDRSQRNPLPRTARAGYGITAGFQLIKEQMPFNILNVGFTVDAEDILVEKRFTDPMIIDISYQGGLGDIDLGKHILRITGDEKVISRTGISLSFLETLVIRRGHFSGRGYWDIKKTDGLEIRLKGIFKLLSYNQVFKYAADHLDIRYYTGAYFSGQEFETDLSGIALVISGF